MQVEIEQITVFLSGTGASVSVKADGKWHDIGGFSSPTVQRTFALACKKCSNLLTDERWPVVNGEVCQECWEDICADSFWKAVNHAS
jgi:hypothetical protein